MTDKDSSKKNIDNSVSIDPMMMHMQATQKEKSNTPKESAPVNKPMSPVSKPTSNVPDNFDVEGLKKNIKLILGVNKRVRL